MVGGFVVLAAATLVAAPHVPGDFGTLTILGAIGSVVAYFVLRSPVFAVSALLIGTFLRVALPPVLPVDLFVAAFAGVLAAAALWFVQRRDVFRLGVLEIVMVLYVLWNIISMLAQHKYSTYYPISGEMLNVPRFILTGTLIPFTLFIVGRYCFERASAVRGLLWTIVIASAYSSAMSIMQFYGPHALVWPRYIFTNPAWVGRACGVFQQPVVNGLTLILGFVVAMLLAHDASEPRWRRIIAAATIPPACLAIYLTHTRSAYLAFAVVVLVGALAARGWRSGFVVTGVLALSVVVINWSVFTSTDREAGGVASPSEVQDRLNSITTAIWAAEHEPWMGWGIGRFTALNTYHHQQWAPDVPWLRGFAIAAHFNELGILAELGYPGLVLWLCVLGLIVVMLVKAYRRLPDNGLLGQRIVVVALMALVALVITGITVDLRFFDFPNAVVLLIAGIAVGAAARAAGEAPTALQPDVRAEPSIPVRS